MFWRQATNVKILVDANGETLVWAPTGSETGYGCLIYDSDSDTVTVGEVVTIEGIDDWGATEITVSTADNVRSFTVDGTTYSFSDGAAITPEVTEWPVPIHYRLYDVEGNDDTYYLVDNDGRVITYSEEGAASQRGFYASLDEFDPTDSWDETNLSQRLIDAWGISRIVMDQSGDFIIDGVHVNFKGNGFTVTPTEYQS